MSNFVETDKRRSGGTVTVRLRPDEADLIRKLRKQEDAGRPPACVAADGRRPARQRQ